MFYQEVVGILLCTIELCRVDINFEVTLMSEYQVSSRRGHIEELIQALSKIDIKLLTQNMKTLMNLYLLVIVPQANSKICIQNLRNKY